METSYPMISICRSQNGRYHYARHCNIVTSYRIARTFFRPTIANIYAKIFVGLVEFLPDVVYTCVGTIIPITLVCNIHVHTIYLVACTHIVLSSRFINTDHLLSSIIIFTFGMRAQRYTFPWLMKIGTCYIRGV